MDSDDPLVLSASSADFSYEVGTSLVTEFAVGHNPADVLREHVQNEYDAGEKTLHVDFGADTLTLTGFGTPIDDAGWRRRRVMLGTETVAGGSDMIPSKINGIGSKNFGLRSLLLFGDQIHVASAGRRTILDRIRGTLREGTRRPQGQPLLRRRLRGLRSDHWARAPSVVHGGRHAQGGRQAPR